MIGAGSAGSIVASKLAASDSAMNVLLIEAGGFPTSNQMYSPSDWFEVLQKYPEIEWQGYQSLPQLNLNNRVIQLPQAKVLGGCALHNATVYVRGSRSDFNEWGKVASGWSWNDVLPYFEHVEQTMKVLIGEADDFINDLFAAASEYGLPENLNYNTSESQYGYSLFQFNNIKRPSELVRETTFNTFLSNLPDNLTLLSQALVTRILFDRNATAIGVEYIKDQNKHIAYVQNEIILSAGAIASPKILMLSGIGDESQLAKFNIPTVANIPEVGKNLHDDLFVSAGFSIPETQEVPTYAYSLAPAVIFGSTQNSSSFVDIESSVGVGTLKGFSGPKHSFWLWPNIMHLESKGTVTLRSNAPDEPPVIDPGYLTALGDLQKCKMALQLGIDIGNKVGQWRERQIAPEPNQDLESYIRENANTTHHFCGTCRMGNDEKSVVDTELRVRKTSGLRVIDASVFPLSITANTAAATMMIAARGIDKMLQNSAVRNQQKVSAIQPST
ncbi:GMC family oxidoreductase [Chroococcidiopsis cubana]|uniref:GMC family oxidoreductase n=1 Tax=Chroococcidiopsis cubana TaxID=171392 RepID=UPI0018F5AB64|nr:GMC family oxidoreductase [Chroococcidiopsis cubana]